MKSIIEQIKEKYKIAGAEIIFERPDEVYIEVNPEDFKKTCLALHKEFNSPVMMSFADDERKESKAFAIYCVFLSLEYKKWIFVKINIAEDKCCFDSLSKDMYSASLFEREIKEMFGLEPNGHPDLRRLNLHDEVWPEGFYPLRKDFKSPVSGDWTKKNYVFKKVEGEGIFEIPVGPVHAGIIGPGHFRFSVAGEPIINLEIRLGWTHKGTEKLFEGKNCSDAVKLSECISGDAAFSYSLALSSAIEKINNIIVPEKALILRAVFLELERIYNHIADIGGIAVDVAFTFPAAFAAIIKENILRLNEKISGSRYLKNINRIGGVAQDLSENNRIILLDTLVSIEKDFKELKNMLLSSVSFMDRVDNAGILKRKTAVDLGVVGLPARAAGIPVDLRKILNPIYNSVKFNLIKGEHGDVLDRLKVRFAEVEESIRMIREFAAKIKPEEKICAVDFENKAGFALGCAENWRGPVLCWVRINKDNIIERCKIVDPSFHNWTGLSFAVLGNIVPDFPLCNKSFDLSYSGNDL